MIPPGHPNLPTYLLMLAAAFGLEYQSSGDLKDFEGALQYYQAAVNLTPGGPERFQIPEGLAKDSQHPLQLDIKDWEMPRILKRRYGAIRQQ